MKLSKMRFSDIEIKMLGKAWLLVSLAFAILLGRGRILSIDFIPILGMSLFTVGSGFVLHELAHKYFAQKYGAWAEFRSDDKWLYAGVIMSFFGFLFLLPGAVVIHGHLPKKRHGMIALAGPVVNLVLGTVFLIPALSINDPVIGVMLGYGAMINYWLGFFNLLPFGLLDGKKVLAWNKVVYGIAMGLAAVGVVGSVGFL
jgi:Zn-dependent protease